MAAPWKVRPLTANNRPAATAPTAPLLGSPELRVVVALLVGCVAMAFAILLAIGRWTDLFMLDLRQWQPATSVRGLQGTALATYFADTQSSFFVQRAFRLTLQLPPGARVGDVLAAEGRVSRRRGRHCFMVLAWPAPAAPETAAALTTSGRVWVDGRHSASFRVVPGERARAMSLPGLDLRGGDVRVRFEIVAEPTAPGLPVTPAAIHFEMATLRRCDP